MSVDTNAVRETLETRAADLIKRDEALTKHLRQQDGRLEADFSDRVAYTEMDEVLEKLDDAARAELIQIRSALERLAEGNYTTCARCGETIAAGRLVAMPTTSFCTNCAEELESA